MNPTNYPPKFLVKIYKSGITPIHYLCLYSDNVILFNENLSSKYEYKKWQLRIDSLSKEILFISIDIII